MGLWDTLKFDLLDQGPKGPTWETEPGDYPLGNLPEGAYRSMFNATNEGGATDWAGAIGKIGSGAGQIVGALNKKGPPVQHAPDGETPKLQRF